VQQHEREEKQQHQPETRQQPGAQPLPAPAPVDLQGRYAAYLQV